MGSKEQIMRMEYEIMHATIPELSQNHGVDAQIIRALVKQGSWEQKDFSGSDNDGDQLDQMNDRIAAMDTLNQAALVPRFIALQAKILDKASSLLDEVASVTDAPMLKIVSDVVELHRPAIMGVKKDAMADNALNIKIMTQVGSGPQAAINAVEITSTAGQSNGLSSIREGIDVDAQKSANSAASPLVVSSGAPTRMVLDV